MAKQPVIVTEPATEETDGALSSSLAIASVGIATLKMLETLLPMAASEVEHESQKLSAHFTTLMSYLHAQADVPQDVKDALSGIITGMQFQDRNTQIMENVTGILERYRSMLEDISRNIEKMRDGKYHSSEDISTAVDSILSGIRLGEIRKRYVEALTKAQVAGHTGEVSETTSANDDNIELF